jgi:solute carrier family 25 iron transporter 28/37
MLAGSCAGVVEHVGMFPVDTVKTHMQAAEASGTRLNFKEIVRTLYKEEGLFRFMNGAQVMAMGCVPAHASYFLLYEHLKIWFKLDHSEFNFTKTAAIGTCTTFLHDFFITPADVVKQRLQLCKHMTAMQALN